MMMMMMMHQEDYTVQLGTFQGPLDLLLFLIRRAEVDIADIPIAEITDQYMSFLRTIERIDIELAGDFLVMAATLMEIKSRMLMPPDEHSATDGNGNGNGNGGEGENGEHDELNAALSGGAGGLDRSDPRYDLVRQLLAYKRFRDAAQHLEQRQQSWANRFPVTGKKPLASSGGPANGGTAGATGGQGALFDTSASGSVSAAAASAGMIFGADPTLGFDGGEDEDDVPATGVGGEASVDVAPDDSSGVDADLEDVEIWDLFNIFQQIIEAVDFGRQGPHQVAYDDTPIRLHQEDLLDLLKRNPEQRISLFSVARGRTRNDLIGLFLATLELVRERRVRVVQNRIRDDILLVPGEPGEDEETAEGSTETPASTRAAEAGPSRRRTRRGRTPAEADADTESAVPDDVGDEVDAPGTPKADPVGLDDDHVDVDDADEEDEDEDDAWLRGLDAVIDIDTDSDTRRPRDDADESGGGVGPGR